jgi:hypothetical protein
MTADWSHVSVSVGTAGGRADNRWYRQPKVAAPTTMNTRAAHKMMSRKNARACRHCGHKARLDSNMEIDATINVTIVRPSDLLMIPAIRDAIQKAFREMTIFDQLLA